MNAILRPLVLFTLAALASRALGEGYFNFEVRTHPSMVGRSLNLTDGYDNASNVGSFTLSWGGTPSAGEGEAVVTGITLWLGDEDPGREWVFEAGGREARVNHGDLVNASTSGGVLTLTFNSPGASTIEFLDAAIYDWDRGTWNPAHGPLALVQNGAFMALPFHEMISGSTVQGQSFELMRGVATGEPSQTFYVVDLSSGRRTPNNATNLAAVEWTADTTTSYPLRPVSFHLNPENWGYRFTLHYQRPGLPEMTQSLVAWPTGSGDSVGFTGSVAAESEFWITRDADGWDGRARDGQDGLGNPLPGPEHMSVFSSAMALHWENYSFPPPEELQPIEVYVPSGMTDGYVHQPHAERQLSHVSSGMIEDYDENANPHFFYYDVYSTNVNVFQPWWLRINGTELSQGEQWYFDGWLALNGPSIPPPAPTSCSGTLILPESRRYHALEFQTPNGGAQPFDATGAPSGASRWVEMIDPWHGEWTLELRVFEAPFDFSYFEPEIHNGSPVLMDLTTGESLPVRGGTLDYSWWQLPTTGHSLQISLSRWGHDLRLRQRTGEEYSITPGSSQGDLALINTGAWYDSYYYFDATGNLRPDLDWWVHDATTGEEAPWNEMNLVNWIHLIPLAYVDHYQAVGTAITVEWGIGVEGLMGGGFEIERRLNEPGAAWQTIATVAATGATMVVKDEPDLALRGQYFQYQYLDSDVIDGNGYHYRVRYRYGPATSSPRSAFHPTDFILDSDNDGMPDAWELAHGYDRFNASDGAEDEDNDGFDTLDEYYAGTDPRDPGPVVTVTAPAGAWLEPL